MIAGGVLHNKKSVVVISIVTTGQINLAEAPLKLNVAAMFQQYSVQLAKYFLTCYPPRRKRIGTSVLHNVSWILKSLHPEHRSVQPLLHSTAA